MFDTKFVGKFMICTQHTTCVAVQLRLLNIHHIRHIQCGYHISLYILTPNKPSRFLCILLQLKISSS